MTEPKASQPEYPFDAYDLYEARRYVSEGITSNCGLGGVNVDPSNAINYYQARALVSLAMMTTPILAALPYTARSGIGYLIASTSPATPTRIIEQLEKDGWDKLTTFWNPLHPERNKTKESDYCVLWGIIPKPCALKPLPRPAPSTNRYQ